MSRSCDYYEEIARKASHSLIGIEPLLRFVANGFRRLGAPCIVVEKHHPHLQASGHRNPVRDWTFPFIWCVKFSTIGRSLYRYCKSVTLTFERLVAKIWYEIGPSLLFGAWGFRRSGILCIAVAKASPSPSNAWLSKSLNSFDTLLQQFSLVLPGPLLKLDPVSLFSSYPFTVCVRGAVRLSGSFLALAIYSSAQ
jgi:hypothetical protein